MRKRITVATLAVVMALSMGLLGGCAGANAKSSSHEGDGQPAPMPVSHVDRYAELGAMGCYGCHGANDKANPQLVGSVKMPEDHYAQQMYATQQVDGNFMLCISCHPQS